MSLVINSYESPYQTWRSISSTGSQTLVRVSDVGQIQYAVFGSGYYGDVKGLYRTTDYGKTWHYLNFINNYITSIQISDSGQIIYLSISNNIYNNYIYKSSDFGETWSLLQTNPEIGYYIINVSNDGTGILLFSVPSYIPTITRSTDGGNSFTSITTNLPATYYRWSIVSSRDFNYIYARFKEYGTAPSTQIYKSIDYGQNWSSPFIGTVKKVARENLSTSRDGKIVVVHESDPRSSSNFGDWRGTLISYDFGETYNFFTTQLSTNCAAFSDENKCISMAHSKFILTTLNGGINWGYSQRLIGGEQKIIDISMSPDGRFQSAATTNIYGGDYSGIQFLGDPANIHVNGNFGY